jgi:glycine/sarcosine N-methyltransferase
MSLYASLASSYDELFPIAPKAAAFLDALPPTEEGRPHAEGLRVLDAGCATGAHALALSALGWTSFGVDSEAVMVATAREGARRDGLESRASFSEADILNIGELFAKERFDLILCLGNTLPHLLGKGAAAFFAQARNLLGPAGALVLQTLNYALPDIGPGYAFPELASGDVTMRRRYALPPLNRLGSLRFVVELTKDGRTQVEGTILQPLAPPRIASMLKKAGFAQQKLYSGWDAGLFDEARDGYLIAVARVAAEGSGPP